MPEKPVYPVTRSFLPPLEEYVAELEEIWNTHWLTNQGPMHQRLEDGLRQYLKSANVTLFTNGHLALDVAIKALGLKGEVITTPFTFASTTHALTMNGLRPVFCDIKAADYTIDETKIEELITPRTSAIAPVHVYGNPCAVEAIDAIAKRHGLKVVYDAAHAFGETVSGRPIASFGDVSMFSFHATKVFHTIEGGALVYGDPCLKRSFDLYKNFGITGPETVEAIGLNAKMSEFQAIMGIVNLRHIDDEIASRGKTVDEYLARLTGVPGLTVPSRSSGVSYNNSYFPVLVDKTSFGIDRDALFDKLWSEGICPRKYFYPLTSDFQCYRDSLPGTSLPVASRVASQVLTLPLYGGLSTADVEYICDRIIAIGRSA